MADYQIRCSIQTNCMASGHITGVRINDTRYSVQEIYDFMRNGDRFYTVGPRTGKAAWVRKYDCACGRGSLTSAADATTDNNLDSLVC